MVAYTVEGCRIVDILDHICDPAQDSTYPQKDGEAPHHLLEELDDLWSLLGRGEGIGPVPSQELCSLDTGETLKKPSKTHIETVSLHVSAACVHHCPGPCSPKSHLFFFLKTKITFAFITGVPCDSQFVYITKYLNQVKHVSNKHFLFWMVCWGLHPELGKSSMS